MNNDELKNYIEGKIKEIEDDVDFNRPRVSLFSDIGLANKQTKQDARLEVWREILAKLS